MNALDRIPNDEIKINSTYYGEFITYNSMNILDCLQYNGNILYEITFNKKECNRRMDYYGRIIVDKITIKDKMELSKLSTFEHLYDIGAFRKMNYEVLYWACRKGYKNIVEFLLHIGYMIHNKEVLEYAVLSNNIDFFIYMHRKINEFNIIIDKDYLLILASKKGYLEIIKYLIYIGADMDTCDGLPIKLYKKNGYNDALEFGLNFVKNKKKFDGL